MALRRFIHFVILFVLIHVAQSQFVQTPSGFEHKTGYANIPIRYKEVPSGICEDTPGVKSYSGYIDVGKDEHLFFWFFEARNGKARHAPLSLWLNGGPGSSSMIALGQENSPCMFYNNGTRFNNPFSWTNASNMIYIDQPVGVGLSYSKAVPGYTNPNYGAQTVVLPENKCTDYAEPYGTCGTYSAPDIEHTANSTQGAAPNVWKALQGFMGAFPEYSRNGFHFTSESYGGHYAPVFSEYFEEQNAKIAKHDKSVKGAHKISLKSVTINNGWYDPILQYPAYYNFTVQPGNTYDLHVYNKTIQDELFNNLYGPGNCVDQLKRCYATGRDDVCGQADTFCANYVENVFDVVAQRDEYDSRELTPDPFPYNAYIQYLNTPKVQQAIGAYTNYSEFSTYVGNAFSTTADDAREALTIEDIRKLLSKGIDVTLWAGDADYNCNWLGGQAVAEEINHHGYSSAGFAKMQTSDGKYHGDVRQSGHFSFSRIFEAGHEVPFYQPLAALELFERSISGLDIATGKQRVTDSYKTSGPKTSTFREGNSTVQTSVLPNDTVYNHDTNAPNAAPSTGTSNTQVNKKPSARLDTRRNGRSARAVMSRSARLVAQQNKNKRRAGTRRMH